MEETDLMSSSCCGVDVVGAVDFTGVFTGVEEVSVVVLVVVFSLVGVADLESSSLSESESESQVRSSCVVCAAPVLVFVSNCLHYLCLDDVAMVIGEHIPLRTSLLLTSSS